MAGNVHCMTCHIVCSILFTFSYTYVLHFSFCGLLALVISPSFCWRKRGSVCVVYPPSCICYKYPVEEASDWRQLEEMKLGHIVW